MIKACFIASVAWRVAPSNAASQPPSSDLTWGSFGAEPGSFHIPLGIAAGSDGTVAVVDHVNQRLQFFAGDGSFIRTWGRVGPGTFDFVGPNGVSFDQLGNVLVSQRNTGTVQHFTVLGDSLAAWDEGLIAPTDVAVSPAGVAYVVAQDILGQHRVSRIRLSDGEILGTFGTHGTGPGQFLLPWGVDVAPDGSVYVADRELHRVTKFTASGQFVLEFGSRGVGDGQFEAPMDVAIHPGGTVFVTDFGNHRVQAFSASGDYLYQWGSFGLGVGQFRYPWAITVGPTGSVYVTDTGNHRVHKFDFDVKVRPTTWSAVKTLFVH